jgi:hypothetical protein
MLLGFAAAISGLCGVGFALLPVILRSSAFGARAERLRQVMLGGQICLCGLLLLGSLSLGQRLLELCRVDMGFDTSGVETARNAFLQRSLEEARRTDWPGAKRGVERVVEDTRGAAIVTR